MPLTNNDVGVPFLSSEVRPNQAASLLIRKQSPRGTFAMQGSLRTNFPAPSSRPDPETVKRQGWRTDGILVVHVDDPRLGWDGRELVETLGKRLYGERVSPL